MADAIENLSQIIETVSQLRRQLNEVEAERDRLRERADLLDLLHDEGFPDEPYLSGRLRAEIERLATTTGGRDG